MFSAAHGIGKEFHEEPFVAHVGVRNSDMLITPGMMFTIEPMINQGHYDVVISDEDGWTVSTKDGKLSAQWEAMLAGYQYGCRNLDTIGS